jgi:hypothetical protein
MLFKKSPAIEGLWPLIVCLPIWFAVFASKPFPCLVIVRRRLHERCEPFQVLNDRSQVELIACAGETPQSHTSNLFGPLGVANDTAIALAAEVSQRRAIATVIKPRSQ